MIHARVDLVILGHERAFAAGPEAMGLWLFMLAWTRDQERDGFVPSGIAHAAWGGRANAKLADRLVAAGLVERVDDGYRIVNYAAKNETKQQIDERRRAEAERKSAYRGRAARTNVPVGHGGLSQWDTEGCPSGTPVGQTRVSQHTEPEPEPEPEKKKTPQRAGVRERPRSGLSTNPSHPGPTPERSVPNPDATPQRSAEPGQPTADPGQGATLTAKDPSEPVLGHPDATGPVDLDQPIPDWARQRWDANAMAIGPYASLNIDIEWRSFLPFVARRRSEGHPTRIDETNWASWLARSWKFARSDAERRRAQESRTEAPRPSPVARELVEAYTTAVRSVVERWAFPPGKEGDLAAVLDGHCVGKNKGGEAKWLAEMVPAFVEYAQQNKPEMWSSFGPKGFLRWLNLEHGKDAPGGPRVYRTRNPGDIDDDGQPIPTPEEALAASRGAAKLLAPVFAEIEAEKRKAEEKKRQDDERRRQEALNSPFASEPMHANIRLDFSKRKVLA